MPKPPDLDARVAREDALLLELRRIGMRAVPLLLPFLGDSDSRARYAVAGAMRFYTQSLNRLLKKSA